LGGASDCSTSVRIANVLGRLMSFARGFHDWAQFVRQLSQMFSNSVSSRRSAFEPIQHAASRCRRTMGDLEHEGADLVSGPGLPGIRCEPGFGAALRPSISRTHRRTVAGQAIVAS
jgi:hypothetical protein